MEVKDFLSDFLSHGYDPVKAHEYYMRIRQLKGRAGVQKDKQAKLYETKTIGAARQQVKKDIKGTKVKMNPKRRIDAAEQKLIRAKSIAQRIKDPTVKADFLARIAESQKKLNTVKKKHSGSLLNTTGLAEVKR